MTPVAAALPAAAADLASPGLAGFLVMFALAVATILLILSMVRHLRKVRYGPDGGTPGQEPTQQRTPDHTREP